MANNQLWELCKEWKQNYKWVDLSHEVSPETPHWSGFPPMSSETLFDYPDGFFVNNFSLVSQYGTHADAPSHFVEHGNSLEHFTAKDLVLPLCVVDVTAKVKNDEDYEVTVADLESWEAAYGKIPDQAFVAIRTDWYKKDSLDNCDAEGNKHYPGWGVDTIKFLVEERNIAAIGHEQSDTDPAVLAASRGYLGEFYILEQNRYQIELMRNLDELPPTGALIFCGFPRAKGAAGFTARCIALCPSETE